MKAILVIDEMPTDCEDCPFGYDYRCFNTWKRFEEKEENRRITYPVPKWCPLIPLSKDSCRIAFDDEDETVVYIRTYKNAHDKVFGEDF